MEGVYQGDYLTSAEQENPYRLVKGHTPGKD